MLPFRYKANRSPFVGQVAGMGSWKPWKAGASLGFDVELGPATAISCVLSTSRWLKPPVISESGCRDVLADLKENPTRYDNATVAPTAMKHRALAPFQACVPLSFAGVGLGAPPCA